MPYKPLEEKKMRNKNFEQSVIKKLTRLDSDFVGKGTCVAWTTFPYNRKNLEVVEIALEKLNWRKEEYILTHDENLIFVEKDLF
jgi:hypothetical protein